jgi:hypothetical protein
VGKLRSAGSALCIVLAALLVPVSVVSSWAAGQLVQEEAFVATLAPLASEPAVQIEAERQAIANIEQQIDIDGLTAEVFAGIAELELSDRATGALLMLEGPAAAGLHSMLNRGVNEFVRSDLFVAAWESSLRVSHRALLAAATQDSLAGGVVSINRGGEIALQLGPVIEMVQGSLSDAGFGLAGAIPVVEASFVVAQSDALPLIALVYAVTNVVGVWLPVLTIGLFILGVLIARKRRAAFIGSGVGMAIGSAALLAVFVTGAVLVQANAVTLGISAAALDAVYSHTIVGMRTSAWVVLILGILIVAVSLAWAKFGWASQLRESKIGAWWLSTWASVGARRTFQLNEKSKEPVQ